MNALARLRDERRYRVFADLERLAGQFPRADSALAAGRARRGDLVLQRLSGHGPAPDVIAAHGRHGQAHGHRRGGTRNIAGNKHPVVESSAKLADQHGKEAALVFTSGYVSNQTGISTLAKLMPDCLILSDALNHNSMIEGVRQSGSEKKIFRHNDIGHSRSCRGGRAAAEAVVVESLYSMDGDVAPLAAIARWRSARRDGVCRRGACGRHVRGAGRRHHRVARGWRIAADVIEGTLARRSGAWAATLPARANDSTRCALPHRDSSSRRPCRRRWAAATAAIRHLKRSVSERERQQAQAARTKAALVQAGIPVMASQTHIVPVFVGDPEKGKRRATGCSIGRHLYPADQLPDGCRKAWSAACASHPRPITTTNSLAGWRTAMAEVWDALDLPRRICCRG